MEKKITICVEVAADRDETDTFEIFQLERPYRQLEAAKVGFSLSEGKDLPHKLQSIVVVGKAEEVYMLRRFCIRCHRSLELKAMALRSSRCILMVSLLPWERM